jgi:hypothetical protein
VKHVFAALLLLAACASAPRAKPEQPRVPPPQLLAPSAFSYDFQWRQRVTARWPTGTQGFDAVLQKRAGELILVGLSPLGLPGFVFRLNEARELQVENRTGQELPFEAAYVVADVQRVFFDWLAPVADGFTGERSGERQGSTLLERYERGALRERRMSRETPAGVERVVVRYETTRALLHNELLGYDLIIETIEQTRL